MCSTSVFTTTIAHYSKTEWQHKKKNSYENVRWFNTTSGTYYKMDQYHPKISKAERDPTQFLVSCALE